MNNLSSPDEVKQAEREVERRKAELSLRLRRAGEQGERVARRLGDQLKPALVGVAVVGGAALLVGVVVLVARSRRQATRWSAPRSSSRASALVHSAGLSLLRLVAKQVAVTLARRMSPPPVPAHSAQSAQ
jgi:hypothetical protein